VTERGIVPRSLFFGGAWLRSVPAARADPGTIFRMTSDGA
jgi:hypothetical protein